jgi:hypothetical protein
MRVQPDGMVLVNTFEEPFGDVYCEGVWSELSKKVSNTICRNVVALASFNGNLQYRASYSFGTIFVFGHLQLIIFKIMICRRN